MAKVDGSLGSIVQGVSQQPDRARNIGQSEEQINLTNDEVFGLARRPSTYAKSFLDKFTDDHDGNNRVEHGIFKSGKATLSYSTRLATVGTDPEIKLSVDDVVTPVALDAAAKAYLQVSDTSTEYDKKIILKELDDKIYAINTDKQVAMLNETPVQLTKNASVIYCRGASYATSYILFIVINGVKHKFAFTTQNGSLNDHIEQTSSKYIVQQLYNLIAFPFVVTGVRGESASYPLHVDPLDGSQVRTEYGFEMSDGSDAQVRAFFDYYMVGEHLILVPKTEGLDYSISANDNTGTQLLVGIKDELDDVGRLPNRAPVGMVVKITGSNKSEDDYFLEWVVEDEAIGTVIDIKGTWNECTAPGQNYKLDPTTLPHEFYNDNGTYKLRQLDWTPRSAGSDDSNPLPKFIGDTIQDIADFQGRLVFLHGAYVSMSETDKYTSWFNKTAAATVDTDPINLRSTATDGDSRLIYAITFNRDLVLFGTNNAQFMITGRRTVTYANASMVITSEFDTDLRSRPKASGENIIYLSWTGKFTQMHEMYLRGNENSHARRTVTDHIPRYMQGRGKVFAADDGSNTAIVVTDDDPTKAYIYEYLWLDDRRVQSAWSTWQFAGPIEYMTIERGILTTVFKSASGGFMTTRSPLYRDDYDGLDFQVHLDHAKEFDLSNSNFMVLNYFGDDPVADDLVAVAITGDGVIGMPVRITGVFPIVSTGQVNQATVTIESNYTGKILLGRKFKTRYVPTMPIVRDGDGVAVSGAELTVNDFRITFKDTGPFDMIRESTYERPEDYWLLNYSGRTLGDPDFTLGSVPMDSDTVEFPFSDLTTTSKLAIETDTHLPMTLTEIEWEGNVKNRSRRLTNGG